MEKAIVKSASELRTELDAKVGNINELLIDSASFDDINKGVEEATDLTKELNGAIMAEEFMALRNRERPMLAAILALEIPKVTLQRVEDPETKAVHYVVRDGLRLIDLVRFEKFCRKNGIDKISHKYGWQNRSEILAKLLSARVTKDIGGDYKMLMRDYNLSKMAAKAEVKETVPTTNKQLTKYLQEFVDMILFDDNEEGKNKHKVTSQDIAFLLALACKPGKRPKTVTMPQGKTIVNLVTQIINRIVTETSYEAMYKRNEEKTAEVLAERLAALAKANEESGADIAVA